MASTPDNLYVTYVDVDRDLLKIWGQRNRISATYIERQLLQLLPEFNRAPSPNLSEIHKGMFCFAKYTDDNYYRARVISKVQNDSVGVLFVDYGNRDIIRLTNIRLQQGNEGDVLAKMSEQAEEYYLARIAAPNSGWTKEIVSGIRRDICYDEFSYHIVTQVGDQKILELKFRDEDFSNYLVKKQLATPLSLPVQRQMILAYCSLVSNEVKSEPAFRNKQRMSFSPSVPHPIVKTSFTPSNEDIMASNYGKPKNSVNVFQPPPGIPYSSQQPINQNIPKNMYFSPANPGVPVPVNPKPIQTPVNPILNPVLSSQFSPPSLVKESANPFNCSSNIIQILAQQVKQYIAADNAKTESEVEQNPHHYVNSALEVGNTYNVITSCIDDGPWSFSIQLMSSETEIRKLMDEISSVELVPIRPPIVYGRACIASSALYGNLCRGVVVGISHSAVKVYFVDFGNTEDLPASSIYELPPKFFKIRVLSQKFSLSGLQKVVYSDDIKKFFKEIVQDELLMLRVTSLEDDNLPTCELYLKNTNIKRLLNEKIRDQRNSALENPPKAGETEGVIVTWVISPQKFFVQLQKRDSELKTLKAELAEVEKKGKRLTYNQLSIGFKCVCRYELDGHWYRVVITSVDSEDAITVFYVDYGNTETVNISLLRRMDSSSLINKISNQAFQCSLRGFENKPYDQELSKKFENMVLEKECKMTVVSSEKELLCVQLLQNGRDMSALLLALTPTALDSFDTSSSSKEDLWSSVSGESSLTCEKEKVSESSDMEKKKDSKNYNGDKTRSESKSSRSPSNFQSIKSPIQSTPIQSKRRVEGRENWRENTDKENYWNQKSDSQSSWRPRTLKWASEKNDRDANTNSKFGANRGLKQDKVRDDWNDNTRSDRNRGLRQDRIGDSRDNKKDYNSGVKKKPEENRWGREGKRFERNRNKDSWKDGGDQSKWRLDRNDNMISGDGRLQSQRKPIRKDEAAPPGSKFEKKVIDIGSCENGIITYYFSPDEFYVQLLTQEKEFTQMMKDIQVYYSDKYSIKDTPQAGDIVIAQFSLDKVLYRAEVIKPSPVTVRYVDYGNQEPVGLKTIWLVNKEFLKLPKQVIKCRLANLRPVGMHWPPPGSSVDTFFGLPEYKCTFLSVEDDMYEIAMEDVSNGKDVATEIIAAGFGLPLAPKLDVPEVDFSLLPNETLRLYVSHVQSSSKFYVILNPKGLEVIENELRALSENKKNLHRLDEALIKPETACLSTKDGISWHRGSIVKIDGDRILVWFSDRGDSAELTADKLMSLPDHLKVFQAQAVQCSLHGVQSVKSEEKFRLAIEDKYNLISVVSATNGSLSVVLYDEDGRKCDFQKCSDFPQAIEPISHLPIVSQKLTVLISHFENPKEIYIQRSADRNELKYFSERISKLYSGQKGFDIEEEREGTLVAVKSGTDETWCRGRLLSASAIGLEVFFIDHGKKEILPRERVKKLDPSFLSSPAFSRKLALDVEFDPEKEEEMKSSFFKFCHEKEVLAYFIKSNGDLIFEIVVGKERISHLLKSLGLVSVNSPDKFAEIISHKMTQPMMMEQPPVCSSTDDNKSEELKVLISHIDTPKQFWVHKESVINDLHQFQEKLKKQSESLPEKENVVVGDVVAALFSDTWYRAKVTDVEGSSLKVQFLDYGNTVTLDLNSNGVKELTEEFLYVPVFATLFALEGNWSENSTALFEEIILQNDDFITAVVLEDSDPAVVDLFQNGQSITELLMEEGFKCEEDESDLTIVYVAHFYSPDDFYVHRETNFDNYNKISERLSDSSDFSEVHSVKKGKIYAAKFPDDGGWYRARINESQGNIFEVYFIDYGNTSQVTEIKGLPSDLIDIQSVAENCCLVYGDNCDSWSAAACEKFAELADGRKLKMKVVAKKGQKSVIELFDGNLNISKELEPLCENDRRSDVYVSFALSPTDFYIQYVDDKSYRLIAEKLEERDECEDLESRNMGTLCQARFVEDGHWYRAKILRALDEECEVFFIDFGNVSMATEIKKLPPEIEDIPPRALRCTLDLSESDVSESAKEEFISLAAGGATVFRALIIIPGEVNVISLKLNGRIIEETLNLNENVSEESNCESDDHNSDFSNFEIDDGKNSKSSISDNYLMSNLEDELKDSGESVRNETDEEKRVKFAQFDGSKGFKSDDEKENGGSPTSGFVNATDSELMKEAWDEREQFLQVSTDDLRDNTLEIVEEVSDEAEAVEQDLITKTENVGSDNLIAEGVKMLSKTVNGDNSPKSKRNKVHKIVSDFISRGEEEVIETCTRSPSKLASESISRGISLESMANEREPSEVASGKHISQSAPCTPRLERRKDGQSYVKIDPNDRVVPGCISTGASFHFSPASKKIPKSDKILAGTVNGSSEEA